MASKISAKRAATMTAEEIRWAPFRGAGPYEFRGLSDAFSVPALQVIAGRTDLPYEIYSRAQDYLAGLDDRAAEARAFRARIRSGLDG